MQILCFDYGERCIGCAVGQTVTKTATPLCILPAKDGQPDWQQVEKLLDEWKPALLLVGLPLNMDSSESDMSERARKFAGRLHGRFGYRVEFHDERLSSFEAKQLRLEQRRSSSTVAGEGSARETTVDAEAAALILQSWLAEQG